MGVLEQLRIVPYNRQDIGGNQNTRTTEQNKQDDTRVKLNIGGVTRANRNNDSQSQVSSPSTPAQPSQSAPAPEPKQNISVQVTSKGSAGYLQGSVYTSNGLVYPNARKGWTPQGYTQVSVMQPQYKLTDLSTGQTTINKFNEYYLPTSNPIKKVAEMPTSQPKERKDFGGVAVVSGKTAQPDIVLNFLNKQRYSGNPNGVGPFIAGVGGAIAGASQSIYDFIFHNKKWMSDTASLIKKATTLGLPEIGQTIRNEPSYTAGFVAGSVAILKAPEVVVKTSDIVRTVSLKELPTSEVVAPEYYKGQTYPAIKKGQTAGELMKEFKPNLPGEKKGGGYTASPNPLQGTNIGAGSSELPGLYQAPKLSPKFLKVSGADEQKIILPIDFSGYYPKVNKQFFNPFGTLKPTAFRITPKEYKLAPGISPSSTGLNDLSKVNKFFTNKANKGTAYIPFVKTEKEAVIPYDTQLKQTNKRFYFEFENRKVPIVEYETLSSKAIREGTNIEASELTNSYYKISPSSSAYKPYSVFSSFKGYSSSGFSSSVSQPKSISKSVSSSVSSYFSSVSNSISKSSSSLHSSGYTSKSNYGTSYSITMPNIKGYGGQVKPNSPTVGSIKPWKFSDKLNSFGNKETGYKVYLKRHGKEIDVPGIYTKGEAIRLGEQKALLGLTATFGVKKTPFMVKPSIFSRGYTPSQALFRDYKIRHGKAIQLIDEFIQRRGKRLSNSFEVAEIQRYRRKNK